MISLSASESLGNRTNNRDESLNQKIKQVIDRNAKFDAFRVVLTPCTCIEQRLTGKYARR